MADFTAKEMRKLANLMENAVQGIPSLQEWGEDHRSEEEKAEQRDVCRMIYQVAKKNNEGWHFERLLNWMSAGHGGMSDLGDLIDDDWLEDYGDDWSEHEMVSNYIREVRDEVLYNDADDRNLEDFRRLGFADTFKELIIMLQKYIVLAKAHEAEGGPSGEHDDIAHQIPLIKMLDTLPLL